MTIFAPIAAAAGAVPLALAGKAVGVAAALATQGRNSPFEAVLDGMQNTTKGSLADRLDGASQAASGLADMIEGDRSKSTAASAPLAPLPPQSGLPEPARPPATVEGIHQLYAELRAMRQH